MAAPPLVTGLGCLTGAGATLEAGLEAMLAGRRDPRPSRRVSIDGDTSYPVFEIDEDPEELLERRSAAMGFHPPGGRFRHLTLLLCAALEALGDARLRPRDLAGRAVGVAIGSTVGGTFNQEAYYRAWRAGEGPGPEGLRRYLANDPARALSRALGLTGPAATVANACSSGADAIGLARRWLAEGRCETVLAGGTDELSRITLLGFRSLMILSTEPCRPFDRHRAGLNLGEGAALLVLEREEAAAERHAPRRGRLLGYGAGSDAWHPTAPHPEVRGLERALRDALAEAGLDPPALAFTNAHGTATPDNDRAEGRFLATALPPARPVVSTKGYTGHCLGAAGAIEAALTLACLERGELPPSAGFTEPDPEVGLLPCTARRGIEGRAALSTSLAFGGSNAALVLGKA